jgi:hypothetical protein
VCWFILTLAPVAAAAEAGSNRGSRDIARQEMAKIRQARLDLAARELLVAPLLPTLPGQQLRLVVNSRFTEAIELELAATTSEGELHLLTIERLEPRATLWLDLDAHLAMAVTRRLDLSLRLSYVGDPEMIQAWVLSDGPAGAMEQQMVKVSLQSAKEWHSFWELETFAPSRGVRPRLAFQNTEMVPVSLDLQLTDGSGERHSFEHLIPAGGTLHFTPERAMKSGTLRARHDGGDGQVQAAAILAGGAVLAQLPIVPYRQDVQSEIYESMIIAADPPSQRRPVLLLANVGGSTPVPIEVELVEIETGGLLARQELSLQPDRPSSLDLLMLLAASPGNGQIDAFRLRVLSPNARVLAHALEVGSAGRPTDIALVSASKAHDSGTYPLPDLDRQAAWSEFLNLGDEPAQIFAHLSWPEGDFALAPFEVAPGGTYVIDFRGLAASDVEDAAGRRFRPGGQPAYLQWMGRRGSSDLIARTFMRRDGEDDAVGFNCFGCCEEFPYGGMVPEFAAFLVGTSANLMAAEYIDTCSGTIGPYYAAPNTVSFSSPVSWSTFNVQAVGQTEQTITFTGSGMYTSGSCQARPIPYFGEAPVVADEVCQLTHNPNFDPTRGCCGMFGADGVACKSCCEREKAVADCRCDKLPFFKSFCKSWASLVSTLDCHGPCAAGCGDG